MGKSTRKQTQVWVECILIELIVLSFVVLYFNMNLKRVYKYCTYLIFPLVCIELVRRSLNIDCLFMHLRPIIVIYYKSE